ncbi:hypothetical protein AB0F91_43800 [Amycolatopsis sp. NPDC023774]|uniref:hypothetical protein n=1 Tax=Amycolatopsis sp. NPDC023774 TaxID=3155015 RepID=UPI0033C4D196
MAFELDPAQVRRDDAVARLRADGYQGSRFEDLARAAYCDELRRQIYLAEAATCGVLLAVDAQRRGVVPWDLWDYQESAARKWASDELKQWWDQHGRLTYTVPGTSAGRYRPSGENWRRRVAAVIDRLFDAPRHTRSWTRFAVVVGHDFWTAPRPADHPGNRFSCERAGLMWPLSGGPRPGHTVLAHRPVRRHFREEIRGAR